MNYTNMRSVKGGGSMELSEKMKVLASGAKYDVSCSSSGSSRQPVKGQLGHAAPAGICHSWSDDGRCISLLKILMSNDCIYDCAYCVNKRSAALERVTLSPEELIKVTLGFYKRNYIEGLFISSAVTVSPDQTMLNMIEVVRSLRTQHGFRGYIHLKGIPGADPDLIRLAGLFVDRMSMNLEVPSLQALQLMAPSKDHESVLQPMDQIAQTIVSHKEALVKRQGQHLFVPAGQTTQFMVGASHDDDINYLYMAEKLYGTYQLKRVYYSAYVPIFQAPGLLPQVQGVPLKREHRLYQSDWLLRFYGFKANEILTPDQPNLDLNMDPKAFWALQNMAYFPVEINKASQDMLLRIPGIGPTSVKRILTARRYGPLSFDALIQMGIVMKRAKYFITCKGKTFDSSPFDPLWIKNRLVLSEGQKRVPENQLSLLDTHERAMTLWLPH